MIVECENCGAPLDVGKQGQRFAKCAYCQKSSRVESMRTMASETPADWSPPKQWVPPESARAKSVPLQYRKPRAAKKSGGCGCLAVIAVLLAAGGGVAAWVGERGPGFFQMGIAGLDADAPPSLGAFTPGNAAQLSIARPGTVRGTIDASVLSHNCRGHLERAPHLALRFATPQTVVIQTSGTTDLTMVIREPNGTFRCDDDSGEGSNPRITGGFAAGTYLVWIGTYSGSATANFTLSVATEAVVGNPLPNGLVPDGVAPLGNVDLDAHPVIPPRQGIATGRIAATPLGALCRGFITPSPTLTFVTREARALTITTTSSSDLTMVVREPSGLLRCDDDSGDGANPLVQGLFAPGQYQVWIGTFSANQTLPFALTLRTELPGDLPLPNGLIPNAMMPAGDAVDLDVHGGSVNTRSGMVSGSIAAPTLGAGCTGFVAPRPQLTLHTTAPRRVRIKSLTRAAMLSLYVRGPAGDSTCASSDAQGSRAEAEVELTPGTHALWVGAPINGRPVPYSVSVEVTQ